MFREIRTCERITERDEERRRENEGFRKIKPETDMTIEEAMATCNQIWMQMIAEAHKED